MGRRAEIKLIKSLLKKKFEKEEIEQVAREKQIKIVLLFLSIFFNVIYFKYLLI